MNKYIKLSLVTLFVTNFTLFLGWVPIGVLIPQACFIFISLYMYPRAFVSKPMMLYYFYFAYQLLSGLYYETGYNFITWVARFLVLAVPLIISTAIFNSRNIKDCEGVSKFAIFISFITVLLSIRILIADGNALRVTSMANSTEAVDTLYYYWKQGMADYGMAAMMSFMPVILIYYFKVSSNRNIRLLLILGVATILVFMFLAQVTTTFILCLLVSLLSCFNLNNRSFTFVGIGLLVILVLTQVVGILDFAVSHMGESAMNDRFSSISLAIQGEEIDEDSDAGIRGALLIATIRSFISNPLLGNPVADIGGHNYFFDNLARYGIIGCIPFFMLIISQYKVIKSFLSKESKRYYQIIVMGFVTLGILKNLSGTEYWNYLFIYYPAMLAWIDTKNRNCF